MKTYMYDLYKHIKSRDDVKAICFSCMEEISEEDVKKHNNVRLNRFFCNKCC